jgi:hypothetical protein
MVPGAAVQLVPCATTEEDEGSDHDRSGEIGFTELAQ